MIPAGVSYCADCRPVAEAQAAEARERKLAYKRRQYNRVYNKKRNHQYKDFYTSQAWRATSRHKLQDCGYKCQAGLKGCQGLAVEVHHIKPIQTPEGWELRLEWSNLEAVCTACHNRRHGDRFKRSAESGVVDLRAVMAELERDEKSL
jgi:5-methylcytosine-specific restriction protein A